MSGHHKFSQLTKGFSPSRKALIIQKTEQIKNELDNNQLKQITPSDESDNPQKTAIEVKK